MMSLKNRVATERDAVAGAGVPIGALQSHERNNQKGVHAMAEMTVQSASVTYMMGEVGR